MILCVPSDSVNSSGVAPRPRRPSIFRCRPNHTTMGEPMARNDTWGTNGFRLVTDHQPLLHGPSPASTMPALPAGHILVKGGTGRTVYSLLQSRQKAVWPGGYDSGVIVPVVFLRVFALSHRTKKTSLDGPDTRKHNIKNTDQQRPQKLRWERTRAEQARSFAKIRR